MAKYHLHLKGYVGASDFNTRAVDKCLAENADNDVRVLIDSTGGSLGTGLSIAAAFKNHGAVDVHFVGLNASAATVASLGARTISIDRNAMYLVHKCSNFVFAWDNMNADELADYIDQLVKNKNDLDKIDDNIAAMYAARCRKDKKALMDLMKVGGWLSAKEALDWGFVDKISDSKDEDRTDISNSLIEDFNAAGIPVPSVIPERKSFIKDVLEGFRQFFSAGKVKDNLPEDEIQEISDEHSDVPADVSDSVDSDEQPSGQNNSDVNSDNKENPGSMNVIENNSGSHRSADDQIASFFDTTASARKLFDALP